MSAIIHTLLSLVMSVSSSSFFVTVFSSPFVFLMGFTLFEVPASSDWPLLFGNLTPNVAIVANLHFNLVPVALYHHIRRLCFESKPGMVLNGTIFKRVFNVNVYTLSSYMRHKLNRLNLNLRFHFLLSFKRLHRLHNWV